MILALFQQRSSDSYYHVYRLYGTVHIYTHFDAYIKIKKCVIVSSIKRLTI